MAVAGRSSSPRRGHVPRSRSQPPPQQPVHCACGLVAGFLMSEFELASADRLQLLCAQSESEAVAFYPDTAIDRVFQAFARYCQYCLNRVLIELMAWRSTKHLRLMTEYGTHTPASPAQDTAIPGDHGYDKRHVTVDIVFVETCIAALSCYDGATIPGNFTDVIESASMEYFRRHAARAAKLDAASRSVSQIALQFFGSSCPSTQSLPSGTIREYLFDLWSILLGRMSPFHLAGISKLFSDGIMKESPTVAVYYLRGLRSLDLRLDSDAAVEGAMRFIMSLFRTFETISGKPMVKDALAETLACIIYPIAVQPTTASVNLTSWYALMTQIYVSVRRWARKPKHRSLAYPLMTVILCVCEPEHFITNFGVLLESLIVFYEDFESRLIALSCIQRLFHVYLEQVAFRKNATSNNLDTVVRRILFGGHKRLPYIDGSHQMEHDGLVGLILTVAEGKFDFCLSEVILRMLNSANGEEGVVFNEHVQLSLRALIAILNRGERRTRLFTSSVARLNLPPGFRTHYGPSVATMLETITDRLCVLQPFHSADLGPYSHQLSGLLGKILRQCDDNVGMTLLTTPYAKPVVLTDVTCIFSNNSAAEALTESVHLPTVIYRFALSALPFIWTQAIPEGELLRIICRASIHQNEGIRVAAGFAIESIEYDQPEMVCRFLSHFAEYLLCHIPVIYGDVALHLLSVLFRVLETHLRSRTSNSISGTSPYGLSSSCIANVQASALFWLTSLCPRTRILCFHILDSVRCHANLGGAEDTPAIPPVAEGDPGDIPHPEQNSSPRSRRGLVLDLIEANEDVIIGAFEKHTVPDLMECCVAACNRVWDANWETEAADRHLVVALCQKTSAVRFVHAGTCQTGIVNEDRWTICYAEMMQRLVHGTGGLTETLQAVFAEAASRLATFLSDRDLKLAFPLYYHYRNIGVLALIASSVAVHHPQARQAEAIIARCAGVVQGGGPDGPHICIAVTALGNVSSVAIGAVLTAIPVQAELHEPEVLRVRIGHIHRLICEGLRSSFLRDNEHIRMRLIAFIQKTCSFLEKDSNNVEFKHHFSVVVDRLCKEAFAEPCSSPLDQGLRSHVFSVLLRWRRSGTTRSPRQVRSGRIRPGGGGPLAIDGVPPHEMAVMAAMSALVLGPYLDPSGVVPDSTIFPWIHSILQSAKPGVRDIGSLALNNLLTSNISPAIIDYYLSQCYAEGPLSRRYFLVFGEFWMSDHRPKVALAELLHLIVYKLGDRSFTVRSMAMDMIPVLAEKRPGIYHGNQAPHMVITSRLPDTYLQTQLMLSARFAREYKDCADDFISTLWKYLPSVPSYDQIIMLRYCECWIKDIDLNRKVGSQMLELLFRVTVEHGARFEFELQRIWRELAAAQPGHSNIRCTLKFILVKCCLCEVEQPGQDALIIFETAKRITLYLSSVAIKEVIQELVGEIEQESDPILGEMPVESPSSAWKPISKLEERLHRLDRSGEEFAVKGHLFKSPGLYPPSESGMSPVRRRRPVLSTKGNLGNSSIERRPSTSHIALMLLVEVAYELEAKNLEQLDDYIILMMHAALLGLDHRIFDIRETCKFLLLNLLHALAFRGIDDSDNTTTDQNRHRQLVARRNEARQLMDHLMSGDGQPLWHREMISDSNLVTKSTDEIAIVVDSLIKVCDFAGTGLMSAKWVRYALQWALRFTNRSPFIACRSHQIFRILAERVAVDQLPAIVHQLEPSLASSKAHASITSEVLATLVIIIDRLPVVPTGGNLADFPQLLWRCMDLISHSQATAHVFVHAATLIIQILEKIPVDDQAARTHIMGLRKRPFHGLQPNVLRGLSTLVTRQPAYILLTKLTLSRFSTFVDPNESRFLMNFVGLLPWLCEHAADSTIPAPVAAATRNLRRLCETHLDDQVMARVLSLYERRDFSSAIKFADAIAPCLSVWMGRFGDFKAFQTLVSMLNEGSSEHQKNILIILGALFRHLNWGVTALRNEGRPIFDAIMALHNSTQRHEVMNVMCAVLQHTCGMGTCLNWPQHQISSSPETDPTAQSHVTTPAASPGPPPNPCPATSPTHAPPPHPVSPPRLHIDEEEFPRIPAEDDDEHQSLTWSGDWARRRRHVYSTHSRRLSLVSNRWRDMDKVSEQVSPRTKEAIQSPRLARAPSLLYPALYRQLSEQSEQPSSNEVTPRPSDWNVRNGDSFGFLRRRSSIHMPSAPSMTIMNMETTRSSIDLESTQSWGPVSAIIGRNTSIRDIRLESPASVRSDDLATRARRNVFGRPSRTPPMPAGTKAFGTTPDHQYAAGNGSNRTRRELRW